MLWLSTILYVGEEGYTSLTSVFMGNLLRPGLDFEDSYSTTISSTGITVFFSLATTSQKVVNGYDAICGYLQTKEQFDILE